MLRIAPTLTGGNRKMLPYMLDMRCKKALRRSHPSPAGTGPENACLLDIVLVQAGQSPAHARGR